MITADDFLDDGLLQVITPDEERSDAHHIAYLLHPYARYGYAVAMVIGAYSEEPRDEPHLRDALIEALEEGLENFRMQPEADPRLSDTVPYSAISFAALERDPGLVQSKGLASLGKYLLPSIVSTDATACDTFDQAVALVQRLKKGEKLTAATDLKRSYAPTVSKINNGSPSQIVPRATLLEATCSAITTVTPRKAAMWVHKINTTIIPDLPKVGELVYFIDVFQTMSQTATSKLMIAEMPRKSPDAPAIADKPPQKNKNAVAPKSEYKRPKVFSGNYPYAPRNPEYFGAVGLLAAIGRWAHDAPKNTWALPVLSSLAERPIYTISYDAIHQEQFDHRVVRMARDGKLHGLVAALTMETRVTPEEVETNRVSYGNPQRNLFELMASRFLQLFSKPAFRDFMAIRAQYPADLSLLFKEYFMDRQPVDPELEHIVKAAGAYGQWLNVTAYHAAKTELEGRSFETPKGKAEAIRKEKSKILTVIESAAMSAKSGQAMIAQVSTQAGRLNQGESSPEAKRFIDAAISGEIVPEDARHLLMAYLRLQSPVERKKVGGQGDPPHDRQSDDLSESDSDQADSIEGANTDGN